MSYARFWLGNFGTTLHGEVASIKADFGMISWSSSNAASLVALALVGAQVLLNLEYSIN